MANSLARAIVAIGALLLLIVSIALNRQPVPLQATRYLPIARNRAHYAAELPPPLSCSSKEATPLTEKEISGIEKFVMFVGYARSGHSIIGSLVDAHPNMIIAHEYRLFKMWITENNRKKLNGNRNYFYNELYQESYRASCHSSGTRSENRGFKGYTLFVNNSWQAQFKDLKVIGDKSGGNTGRMYSEDPSEIQNTYKEITQTVKIPVYSLHVIRNPFDIMSTALLCAERANDGMHRKYEPPEGSKFNNTNKIENVIKLFFKYAKAVRNMISTCKLTVLEIHSEDFVKQPQGIMKRICDFLGVECSPWYLQMCQDKVFSSVSRTRDKVEWTQEQIARVQTVMNTFPYFKGYNFLRDNYQHS